VKKADIGTGIGLIIFSTWIFWYASAYSKAAIYYYGPNFFPQAIAIAMSICAIILILNAIKGKSLEISDRIQLKGFIRMVIAIDRKYLVPLIFITCMVGSYAINNVLFDLITCVIFGFIGYIMLRFDFPVAPMVLAQILGSMMESNFRRALSMSQGDFMIFFTRPITVVILALAVFTTIVAVRRQNAPDEERALARLAKLGL